MTSNYPPGVTGLEPQIVGYDEVEALEERTCANCSVTDNVLIDRVFDAVEVIERWACDHCGALNDEAFARADFGVDPDSYHDQRAEGLL